MPKKTEPAKPPVTRVAKKPGTQVHMGLVQPVQDPGDVTTVLPPKQLHNRLRTLTAKTAIELVRLPDGEHKAKALTSLENVNLHVRDALTPEEKR